MTDNSNRLAALGSAAAGIAHDINNELTLILNYIDMAERSNPHREYLLAAAARCTKMTSSLLAWSKGEHVSPKPIDLTVFIRDFGARISMPNTVKLHLAFEEPSPLVLADEDALDRILRNLVDNALTAMNDKGTIWLSASRCRLTIADSGPGVDLSDQARIFEPFFSTGKKRAQGQSGSGLGLAIVQELMSEQGGAVRLVSEPGRGACFELEFLPADVNQRRSRS